MCACERHAVFIVLIVFVCRCFFDLLVLQSRGLVALQCGEKDAAAEPNGDLSVQMTQLGLSQRLATGLSQQ